MRRQYAKILAAKDIYKCERNTPHTDRETGSQIGCRNRREQYNRIIRTVNMNLSDYFVY